MASKNIKNKVSAYSTEKLLNDITSQYESELSDDNEVAKREKMYKLNVICRIVNIVSLIGDRGKDDISCKIKAILLKDDKDIYGYTCYMAVNSQYNYSWSYLREQWKEYHERIEKLYLFFWCMISDTNYLYSQYKEFGDKEFLFADVFSLSFDRSTHVPRIKVKWEDMTNIYALDKGYSLSVKKNGIILISVFSRYDANNDAVKSLVDNLKSIKIEE